MRLLYHVPEHVCIEGDAGGLLREIRQRAAMAETSGFRVDYFDSWKPQALDNYDAVHTFMPTIGRAPLYDHFLQHSRLIVSPILDPIHSISLLRGFKLIASFARGMHNQLVETGRVLASCAGVFVRSEYEENLVVRLFGVVRSNIRIVPNALEWPPISPKCEEFTKRWKGRDFLLFVGDPTNPRKNLTRTIKALGSLGHPFLIAGPNRRNAKMEELTALADRYPNVHFLGFLPRNELWQAYCACKAVVLASLNEGTGLAALEAAGMGAQVIITRHGGASTYFGNKAIYVEPRSIRSIQAGAIEALNKPREREFAESVRRAFGMRAVASVQERAYKDLIAVHATDQTAVSSVVK